ncbi:hypothetical protein H072_8377 [Dactylellina haptotyla CBS 200.50]|uniref:SWIM-type domain-containing protein n=1 Tax=Dactylellina haptotyla (strain CBS 200.50) TaxID=1284197 RepID=S8A9Z4_DACHA|nr:hypothetical protein H072_8377 [Dactylellina haptotyla CBS 200.50]
MTYKVDLPSRVLLSSLFNSMATIELPSTGANEGPPAGTYGNTLTAPANPLRNLTPQSKNLFLTAHCLLPATFLAALDLLEKSLVVRYRTSDPSPHASMDVFPQVYYIRSNPPPPQNLVIPGPNFTSTTATSRSFPKSAKSYVYEVRTASWNCTCIAFTLAAYQRHTLLHTQNKGYGLDDTEESGEQAMDFERLPGNDDGVGKGLEDMGMYKENKNNEDVTDVEWDGEVSGSGDFNIWYGGISTLSLEAAGKGINARGSAIPVCKHLLAAALAEKCKALFGGYVVEQVVTADEMIEKAVLWG